VTHPIWVYEIHGKIEEETFLLSADFGNAFPIKDYLLNNPHHPTKFFTLQDRKTKFEKKGMVLKPKHFVEPYPLWLANGIAEDADDLRANSLNIRRLITDLKAEFEGKEIFFNGSEKKIHFNTTSVMAGPVMEEGLLALSDINLDPVPEEPEDVVDDATPIE
jgi:hypothetical protein